jgi:hypothetical protein
MTYRYEITSTNEIYAWSELSEKPFLYQPTQPDGTPWASKAEAEQWVQDVIADLKTNEQAPEVIEDAEIVEEETNA